MKNIILVGLGPHAKRIYYPFLEKYRARNDIHLKLLIDLACESRTVAAYLAGRTLQPERTLYLPATEANRMGQALDDEARKALDDALAAAPIDGIIISTEPKAHRVYAEWALAHNVNILMDKPITAPLYPSTDIQAARQIYGDYLHLNRLQQASTAKFYVVCQRRNHAGYTFMKEYLRDFTTTYALPISYIDIYHADGAWSLPHEFGKENHPYKYGYGKLMHSGYHFVDLFSWLAQTNFAQEKSKPDRARVYTARFTPNDLFHQIDEQTHRAFFARQATADFYTTYDRKNYEHYGELDAFVHVQLLQGPHVITTGSINLQQNSFSRRGWFDLPADTYKGNGRVRHERVNIQVSHFLNMQVHSYQSCEPETDAGDVGGIGSDDHFDVLVFRNTKMVGGDAFQKISIGQDMRNTHDDDPYYLGHNERARETTLLHFLEGAADESEFAQHDFTNKLLSNIYASIAQGTESGNAQVQFSC